MFWVAHNMLHKAIKNGARSRSRCPAKQASRPAACRRGERTPAQSLVASCTMACVNVATDAGGCPCQAITCAWPESGRAAAAVSYSRAAEACFMRSASDFQPEVSALQNWMTPR
jgi:hypothetical protein